jgi:putative membrane protein
MGTAITSGIASIAYHTVDPQLGQKWNWAALPSSLMRTYSCDSPLIVTHARGQRACAANTLPERRWQSRQWQIEIRTGSPVTVTVSFPQGQAAVRVASVMQIRLHSRAMTIQNFTDHAANERTFLAWVRTSIAVIAFGFLVERFDLFIAFMVPAGVKNHIAVPRGEFGHIAGLTLIVLGTVMIGVAAWRFARTSREIDDDKVHPGTARRMDLALAALLLLLCAGLIFYLVHALSASA